MKAMLLILITLALLGSSVYAQAAQAKMTDAEIKALIVGTWTADCTQTTSVFQADGKEILTADDIVQWDVKDGALLEIDSGKTYYFEILLLTKHEFLIREANRGHSYLLFTHKD
jgi:hypothetical protein